MKVIAAACFAVGVLFGVGVSHIGSSAQPKCPSEDSCTVDYRDGAWHITPQVP
jgi:hypothetical protein